MKKHHPKRRNHRLLFASALTAAAVCSMASCGEQAATTLPPMTTDAPYLAETTVTVPKATDVVQFAPPAETTAKDEQTTDETAPPETATEETTTASPPAPVIREEVSEVREKIPYETVYEYSSRHYMGTERIKREGENGELLRVTITTYANDDEIDTSVTETVVREPVSRVILVGIKPVITYNEVRVTEDYIPFLTETRKDSSRYDDERTILQTGMDGYTEATYRITYEKGIEVSRERIEQTVIAPITEIVSVGTKPAWAQKTVTEREHIVPYETKYVYDDTLAEGTRFVKTKGEDGYTASIYTLKYYRGELSSRELSESTVYAPKAEVIVIGTKKEEAFGLPFYAGRGYTLTQDFGGSHYAMDFAVWYGDPILSIGSGTVIYAYDEGYFSKNDMNWTYGTFVVIEHENGVRSLYAHLGSRTVRAGQKVTRGQTIGYSGNTGRVNPAPTASNPLAGTHLHFEIRVNNVKVDPKKYIPDF